MSRVCCFILCLFSVAVRFGKSADINYNRPTDCNITPGFEKTTLCMIEKYGMRIGESDLIQPENMAYSEFLGEVAEIQPQFISPGTKWCGDGDRATNDNDLGKYKETDACCRTHDKCQNNIEAGQKMVNLHNNGKFTRSACECDEEFFRCLKAADNLVAYSIGKTYFNVLGPQCFECVCPTEDCKLGDGTECKDRCLKYRWRNNRRYNRLF